jgi:DNA-binding NarL/FixJ family response regulator
MPSPAVHRIGVQSNDRLRREALAAYLETLPTFRIVGHVASYPDARSLCMLEQPEIMVLDGGRGAGADARAAVAACRAMRSRVPGPQVVLMYEHLTPEEISEYREAGVSVLVPYSHGLGGVVSALNRISAGLTRPTPPANGLSDRQREVLLLVASGHSANEIGELLHISPGTVENHKRRVYAKLNAVSAVQAVARAAALGIIGGAQVARTALPATDLSPLEPAWLEPDPEAGPEPGRPPMVVAIGNQGDELARVVKTLIVHQLPVVCDAGPPNTHVHWQRWHRGPVVRVLVNPTPQHWRVASTLSRSAVVVHSGPLQRESVAEVLSNGGLAIVPADHIEDRLIPVVNLVVEGYIVMDSTTTRPFLNHALTPVPERNPLPLALTAREHDILRSIGRSHTVRQTARSLGIAVKTVENAQGHLFNKLGVHNRAHALAAAYTLGLLQPDSGSAR